MPTRSANAPGLHDVVVIAFARREQGLLVAPGNPLKLSDIASVAAAGARIALRPNGAGAQLLLLALLAQAGLAFEALNAIKPPCPTGPDIAQAVRTERADCGIATRAVALAAGLDFVPLTWERFDLALRQRDYFMPGPQALFDFLRTAGVSRTRRGTAGLRRGRNRQRSPRQLRLARLRLALKKAAQRCHDMATGQVAEWLKALAWKACIRETVSWVRIPPCPPNDTEITNSAWDSR